MYLWRHVTWLTLRRGDTSTACLLTVPARPIRVESSRGPLLMMAFTKTWRGFCSRKTGMALKPLKTVISLTLNIWLQQQLKLVRKKVRKDILLYYCSLIRQMLLNPDWCTEIWHHISPTGSCSLQTSEVCHDCFSLYSLKIYSNTYLKSTKV